MTSIRSLISQAPDLSEEYKNDIFVIIDNEEGPMCYIADKTQNRKEMTDTSEIVYFLKQGAAHKILTTPGAFIIESYNIH